MPATDFADLIPPPETVDLGTNDANPFADLVPQTGTNLTEAVVAKGEGRVPNVFSDLIPQSPTSATETVVAQSPDMPVGMSSEDEAKAFQGAPDWLNKASNALVNTAKGFVPTTVGQAVDMLTPWGSVKQGYEAFKAFKDVLSGVPLQDAMREHIPMAKEMADAEMTPAWSQERWNAGFNLLGQLGMSVAMVKGIKAQMAEHATAVPGPQKSTSALSPVDTPQTDPSRASSPLSPELPEKPVPASEPLVPREQASLPPSPEPSEAAVKAQGEVANAEPQTSNVELQTSDVGLGIRAAQIPGFETVARPWVNAAKGLLNAAKSMSRFAELSPQRDMVSAKFDAANNEAGYVARQARRHVELAGSKVPLSSQAQELRQQAATFVRQANGDKEAMLAKFETIRGKGYDKILDYAEHNWDKLEKVSSAAKEGTKAAFLEAESAGVALDYRDNYVKGAYDFPFDNKVVFDEAGGGRGTSTSFKKAKVFNDYAEAIAAGFKPKELRLDYLTESAVHSTLKVVNRKKWAQSLGEIKMPDGAGLTAEAMSNGAAPRGYKMLQVTPGHLIPIHEELAPTIQALTSESMIPKMISHGGAFLKHNILVFDIFHGSRFAKMQAAFERRIPSYHKGLALLEYADADLNAAVKHNLINGSEADWARSNRPRFEGLIKNGLNAGRISDAIYADAVPLMPGAKQANRFIFEKLSRGIITQSAMTALERNAKAHPEWSPEQLNRYTAKEVNTYYRNLGNQGIFKSKTFQDLARAFVFAPQWIEGMVRSEARGYGQLAKLPLTGKLGNIGAGMGTGLVAYFAVAQVVNMLTRGQPTWENNEPGHKFDVWIPDILQGSGGFFISPLSVFAETTHDAIKYTERGMEPLDVASQLATNKLHPQVRAMKDLFGGKDFFGRPLHGMERVTQALADVAPVPLFARTGGYKGGAERQLLSTLGEKATPAPSASSNIYHLASEFKREHNIKMPDSFPESEYATLRRALADGDTDSAQTAYDELRKTKSLERINDYFNGFPERAFTGSKAMEPKFRASLDRGQLDLYNAALRERKEITQAFRAVRKH